MKEKFALSDVINGQSRTTDLRAGIPAVGKSMRAPKHPHGCPRPSVHPSSSKNMASRVFSRAFPALRAASRSQSRFIGRRGMSSGAHGAHDAGSDRTWAVRLFAKLSRVHSFMLYSLPHVDCFCCYLWSYRTYFVSTWSVQVFSRGICAQIFYLLSPAARSKGHGHEAHAHGHGAEDHGKAAASEPTPPAEPEPERVPEPESPQVRSCALPRCT